MQLDAPYEPPPARDRLPTMPEDMSEYAWLNTGPQSWSNEPAHEELLPSDDLIDEEDDDEVAAGLLVDMWHGDVPRVIAERVTEIDEREAHVLSLMDGRSTVGMMLVTSVLSVRDIVATLCELRARGVVTLDRKPAPPSMR
jgi:hypothetical protein